MADGERRNYSDSGAAGLIERITEMVSQDDRCPERGDNASEIEMMRMDEVPLPKALTKAATRPAAGSIE